MFNPKYKNFILIVFSMSKCYHVLFKGLDYICVKRCFKIGFKFYYFNHLVLILGISHCRHVLFGDFIYKMLSIDEIDRDILIKIFTHTEKKSCMHHNPDLIKYLIYLLWVF